MEEDERGKLFVGGLSWETTQENLQRYFARYGEIIDCVVMKNNDTGRSRGFGFVTFSDPNNVGIVLKNGPHTLDGRTIDPKPCNPRTLQKPKKGGGYKIFLGGLPSNVTETDLRTFFGRYGKVTEVVIMYDQEKKKSRGFGFLSFEDEGSVECVTNERYINLNGKQVEIKKAEPRDGGGYSKMNADPNQWNHHQGAPLGMMQGPNGQMNGPQMNMPMGAPNMMPGYQNWATSPQQQGYGYGNSSAPNSYQGWGAPPQGPPPQWSNYNPQQTVLPIVTKGSFSLDTSNGSTSNSIYSVEELAVKFDLSSSQTNLLKELQNEDDPLVILNYKDAFRQLPGYFEFNKIHIHQNLLLNGAVHIKEDVYHFPSWPLLLRAKATMQMQIPWAFYSFNPLVQTISRMVTIQTTIYTNYSPTKFLSDEFEFFKI
ncbi:heterogeneous nuclear ribonucleoprotein 27C isoform X1 [Contarinia nasturtii]|uniref:heterogeneous nuclear ribonucleoprotein 27C isoform X1 n=1 Tax=Contarinia nasturtii TaxID=265458 RepID=UPI0012D42003|nr:heterogeneous nuclear ribonucleoprotein 27C isoform X1 [Contarinia nasturtii]